MTLAFSRIRASWRATRARLDHSFARYGRVALGTYVLLDLVTWATFYVAMQHGVHVHGAVAGAGAIGAAWAASKVTQPARALATVVLTPFVARMAERLPGGFATR